MTKVRIDETGLPMRLRRVKVTADGTLLAQQDRATQHFRFRWRDVEFVARYRHDAEGARVRIAADMGPLPYAAEQPQAFADLKAIVDAMREELGPLVHVSRDRRIVVGGRELLAPPMTADRLMATLAGFLLKVDPYLPLLKQYRAAV